MKKYAPCPANPDEVIRLDGVPVAYRGWRAYATASDSERRIIEAVNRESMAEVPTRQQLADRLNHDDEARRLRDLQLIGDGIERTPRHFPTSFDGFGPPPGEMQEAEKMDHLNPDGSPKETP